MKRCPVCDWEIEGKGVQVTVGKKKVTVCCDECAKKIGKEPKRDPDAK